MSAVSKLLHRIGEDAKTIAADEVELTRNKLAEHLSSLVARAGVAILGATVALFGLAMLSVVAVVALEPVMPALWLRLLIMAVVYLGIGGVVAGVFARRLARLGLPDLSEPVDELKATVDSIETGLTEETH